MNQTERSHQAKQVTLLGGAMNGLLGTVKLIGGFLCFSQALIADGIHSFSDLLADVMVFFASKYGSQDADHSHPYGHQRIETAAILILSLLLIFAGVGIIWHACFALIHPSTIIPHWLALPIAIFSLIINEILFHYTRHIGKRIQSALLIANAWHHRVDAASSLIICIGLLGSLLGYIYLDALAASIVGAMIIKMGWEYGWNSVKELVDSAVEPPVLAKIAQIIIQVDGIIKIHQLRTRMMGHDIYIDVHIQVLPAISVSEGHYIAQHVHHDLLEKVQNVKDVTVHVDPEDDESCKPSYHLPNRLALERSLLNSWQATFPQIMQWKIHYLDGAIIIDLFCHREFTQWDALRAKVLFDIDLHKNISQVCFLSMGETVSRI